MWRPAPPEAAAFRALLGARRRGLLTVFCRPDPDRLDVDEFLDSVVRQLATVAGPLDPAERQTGVRRDHAVDEHKTGFDPLRHRLGTTDIPGPDVGAQPEVGVVRDAKGILRVLDPDDRGHRAKRLLVVRGHARPNVGQDSGLEVVAVTPDSLAASQGVRAQAHRLGDLSLELLDQVASRQWPDLVGAIHRVADLEGGHRAREAPLELIGNRLFDDEALGGDAALSVVLVARSARDGRGS